MVCSLPFISSLSWIWRVFSCLASDLSFFSAAPPHLSWRSEPQACTNSNSENSFEQGGKTIVYVMQAITPFTCYWLLFICSSRKHYGLFIVLATVISKYFLYKTASLPVAPILYYWTRLSKWIFHLTLLNIIVI